METLYFTPKNITKGIKVIRQWKSLKRIGLDPWDERQDYPAEEFWKRYDAGDSQTSNQKREGTAPPADKQQVNLPDDASVDDLRKALKDAPPARRESAAARLAKLGPQAKPALDALAETMNDTNNPARVRSNAALAIANTSAEAKPVVSALAKALQSSQPQEVRMYAAEALKRIEYPANEKGIPAILHAIEKDTDADVRNKCMEALFAMQRPEFKESGAEKLLTKVLDERSKNMDRVRYSAARKLAHLLHDKAPDKTADVLLEWLTDPSTVIYKGTDIKEEGGRTTPQPNYGGDARYLAAMALGWLGDKAAKRPDVAEALRKAAKDKDEQLKTAAQNAMKELNIKEAEPKKPKSLSDRIPEGMVLFGTYQFSPTEGGTATLTITERKGNVVKGTYVPKRAGATEAYPGWTFEGKIEGNTLKARRLDNAAAERTLTVSLRGDKLVGRITLNGDVPAQAEVSFPFAK